MSTETSKEMNPSRDEFAALLAESLAKDDVFEGSVVKGKIVGIEKDLAVIDVGLKMEGRVPLKEFGIPGKPSTSRSATPSKFTWSASRMRSVKPFCRATRLAARRAGPASRSCTRRARRSRASSSTRSRAASPSISTAPWRSFRARRSTSAPCATSAR